MQGLSLALLLIWFANFHALEAVGGVGGLNVVHYDEFNVLHYGARGDGYTYDTQAFLRAWSDFCRAPGEMQRLVVPAGTFLLKPVIFQGPCLSKWVHIRIQGSIVAPIDVNEYNGNREYWIQISGVNGLIIDGGGQIDGRGYNWWKACGEDRGSCSSRPTGLHFNNIKGLGLYNLRHVNSPRNHISINNCFEVDVSGIQITAPFNSPNTDGLDVRASSNIRIRDSTIATGDDCIAINGFTYHVNISGIVCGPGHGISVGSLGRNGAHEEVEDISVRNCTFTGTDNGARIKTFQGGSGFARRITFADITVEAAKNPIIIDQYYNSQRNTGHQGIQISNVLYADIRGSSATDAAIILDCSGGSGGCSNIVMKNINICSTKPGHQTQAICRNAHGTAVSTYPNVPCLTRSQF